MPILDVEIIQKPGQTLPADLAARIAEHAGKILGTPAGRTWVKIHHLPATGYAENGLPPGTVFPVFVALLKSHLPPAEALQAEVTALTTAVADCCERPPENVHIFYHSPATGRVAFGGRVVQPE